MLQQSPRIYLREEEERGGGEEEEEEEFFHCFNSTLLAMLLIPSVIFSYRQVLGLLYQPVTASSACHCFYQSL
jgi:hypothetical protein